MMVQFNKRLSNTPLRHCVQVLQTLQKSHDNTSNTKPDCSYLL